VRLIPFYENHFQRYAIYWRRVLPDEAGGEEKRLAAAATAQKELDARTTDRVQIGDAASEKAHGFKGLRSFDGIEPFNTLRPTHWRDAREGGWFSYQLKVDAGAPQVLRCTYWRRQFGARQFDVLVDGELAATTELTDTGKEEFLDVDLPLNPKWLEGKNRITVKFQARPGNFAGGIFDLRILSAPSGNMVEPAK
jgi:uncharacterized protein